MVLTLLARLEGALAEWFRNLAPEAIKDRLTREQFDVGGRLERAQGDLCPSTGVGFARSRTVTLALRPWTLFNPVVPAEDVRPHRALLRHLLKTILTKPRHFNPGPYQPFPSNLSTLQEAVELLTCDPTVRFFITCLNFLHEEFVRRSPSYPREHEGAVSAADTAASGTFHARRSVPEGGGAPNPFSRSPSHTHGGALLASPSARRPGDQDAASSDLRGAGLSAAAVVGLSKRVHSGRAQGSGPSSRLQVRGREGVGR